jgi:hypothetical protein
MRRGLEMGELPGRAEGASNKVSFIVSKTGRIFTQVVVQ